MIQRIQTIYLSINAILQLIFAFGTYFTYQIVTNTFLFKGDGVYDANGLKVDGDSKTFFLALGAAVLSFIIVALFKNRTLQIKLTKVGVMISLAEIIFLVVSYINIQDLGAQSIGLGWVVAVLPISAILFFLAGKAIKKDDDLVKSVDRIR